RLGIAADSDADFVGALQLDGALAEEGAPPRRILNCVIRTQFQAGQVETPVDSGISLQEVAPLPFLTPGDGGCARVPGSAPAGAALADQFPHRRAIGGAPQPDHPVVSAGRRSQPAVR